VVKARWQIGLAILGLVGFIWCLELVFQLGRLVGHLEARGVLKWP
jgi:hypothetical protein